MVCDFDEFDEKLRYSIGCTAADARKAILEYENQNMRNADVERRKAEECCNGCSFMGYAPLTLRRIVYCWREGIGFYEDMIHWKSKQAIEKKEKA